MIDFCSAKGIGCYRLVLSKCIWNGEENMFFIKVKTHFDSAHFLQDYVGKCSNIHGHKWQVEFEIKSETLNEEGTEKCMICDFSKLKSDISNIIEKYDHCLIIEKGSLKKKTLEALLEEGFRIVETEKRPTAEYFALLFFIKIKKRGYPVYKVSVLESETNCAMYKEENNENNSDL